MAGLRGGPGTDPREIGRSPGRARFRQQYLYVFEAYLLRLTSVDQVITMLRMVMRTSPTDSLTTEHSEEK
jgi:hypothetical protein